MRTLLLVAGVLAILELRELESAVKEHARLFVEVYVPWCGHCRKLEGDFSEAAEALEAHHPPVTFARLNAEEGSHKLNLTGYPALLYYEKGEMQTYTGPKTASLIMQWLLHKVEPAVTVLPSQEALASFLIAHPLAAVLFDNSTSEVYSSFQKAAELSEEHIYALATASESLEKYSVNASTLILFKPSDDRQLIFNGTATTESIQTFIRDERAPWMSPLNETSLNYIFEEHHPAVLVFYPYQRNNYFLAVMEAIAPDIKEKIRFVFMDLETADGYKLADFLGIDMHSQPTALILDWDGDQLLKYLFTEESLNKETLRAFIEAWKNEDLVPFYKSEPAGLPGPSASLLRLSANNFKSIISNPIQPVFVLFYVPYSSRCKSALALLEPMAKEYADKAEFRAMDMLQNEVQGERLDSLPALRRYWDGKWQAFEQEWTEHKLRPFVAS